MREKSVRIKEETRNEVKYLKGKERTLKDGVKKQKKEK